MANNYSQHELTKAHAKYLAENPSGTRTSKQILEGTDIDPKTGKVKKRTQAQIMGVRTGYGAKAR